MIAYGLYVLIGFLVLTFLSGGTQRFEQLPLKEFAVVIALWPAFAAKLVHSNIVALVMRFKLWKLGAVVSTLMLLFVAAPMHAQAPVKNPPLMIFADTAGVSRVQPDIYVTWVFAKATPTGLPSSGILVAFDCKQSLVKRLAHVVYHLNADSTGVTGDVAEDDASWVAVSVPTLFNLVCQVGSTRPEVEPEVKQEIPQVSPKNLYPVS